MHNLGLPKGLRVAHEYVLLGTDSDFVKLGQIIAACASTSRSTVSVVCKALTVKLKTLRFTAVAWLVGRRSCTMDE